MAAIKNEPGESDMYTLYHANGACSLAVKAALTLANVEFRTVTLDFSRNEHLSPDYRAINPFGKVPALDTGEFVLTEGVAIHLYLAEQYSEAHLLPDRVPDRYQALKWLSVIYCNLHPHFVRMFYPERFGTSTQDIKQKATNDILSTFSLIDRQLESSAFLSGDSLGPADLYLTVQLHWAKSLKIDIEPFNSFTSFLDSIHRHEVIGEIYKSEYSVT